VVVVLVGLLVAAMIPPACRHVKINALRQTCRANLATIGKAMLTYASDHEGKFPCAGGRNPVWGNVSRWDAPSRTQAFGLGADGSGGRASISSCFYLLVKYAGLMPEDFLCPGDVGATEFRLSNSRNSSDDFKLADAWDFGPDGSNHCSFAYHVPFGVYGLSTSSDPHMAVAADRSPWFLSFAGRPGEFRALFTNSARRCGRPEPTRHGNSKSHGQDGQNVLFVDGHVSFEERSDCGLDQDNIYLPEGASDTRGPVMVLPTYSSYMPFNENDSVLIHDPVVSRTEITHQAREVDSKSLKRTAVVATLDCPPPEHRNVIWCSTFQMAWDRFKTDIIHGPIEIPGAETLTNRLNRGDYPVGCIEERSYYANAGFVAGGILDRIRRDMKTRFPAEPAPSFDDRYTRLRDVAVAYAYVSVDVGFQYPYYSYAGTFGFTDSNDTHTPVTAFCAQGRRSGDSMNVSDQVDVLHYDFGGTPDTPEVEFIVDLCRHTQPYQVILARVPRCATFAEASRVLQTKTDKFKEDPDYEVLRRLRPIDTLTVPDILYKLTHHFDELLGKPFRNAGPQGPFLFEAMQRIDFTLSRTGVILKSEAMAGASSSRRSSEQLAKPRHLRFDKPFLICVKKREPGATPFFLMWVDNAELMQTVARER
jgi:prepilin-type processing-associated H-X9-DG protein